MNKRLLIATLIITASMLLSAQEKRDALKNFREGKYKVAIDITLEEIETLPDSSLRAKMDAYTVLLWSLIVEKRYDEAITYGNRAKDLSPYDSRITEALGEAYYFKGSASNALKFFELYTVQAPLGDRIARVYNFMGEIYITQAKYNHADIAFSTALYHAPSVTRWWYRLGYSRELAEDFKGAETAYNKALDLDPSFAEATRALNRIRTR
ncbi:tetratricopeptide repeat protein [Spirochaeta isovalerica]|uniref:Tetratricopeptide (TPR) repeat protein n=1 Tax=Spirochaeta isovalerica TaxID=150 RepID=A0A841RCN3_9SPIO|nr:tetratricopeptide repeat protein [Spirochaeta isovalerica]MBB6480629.1 tetratricopeptide (TPR) repeat protein [Spirochaeta isovalerica]